MGRRLNKQGLELEEEFEAEYGFGHCCSCHLNPPCGYCTHPGNPSNLEEDDAVWEEDNEK